MMQAIVVARFGAASELALAETPMPLPGRGEVRVKVAVAGVNYIDVYMRTGAYARSHTYPTPLPFVPGMEGAGTVEALGEGVRDIGVGDRVAWCLARGSYAPYAVVPAWKLVRVPDDIDLGVACALMLQGSTAHYLVHSAFALHAGDRCLVHAAAGGVGQLLVQLAKGCGATVLATVGSAQKAEIARARGADHVILYREVDFREELMRLTHAEGVDVVYDSVGRDTIHRSIRCLRRRGLCVMFGAASGQVEAIAPLELAEAGSVYFTRPHLADYLRDAAEIRDRAQALFSSVRAGALRVAIDRTLPLAAARDAHDLLEGRATHGKLLLAVSA